MNLEYLFSPTKQFTYPSGKLLDGGKIFVYLKDTTDLATLYSPEGSFVSNPILLDANGRASVRADVAYQYRLEVYTNKDVLLYTCEAFCEGEGSGSFSFVVHDETLSGTGTGSSPLGVVNIPLAVNETMTAYEEVVEGENALVLGVNSAWLNDKLGQALDGKVDRTEFEDCCSAVNAALENKLDSSAFDLSNYYNKQETNNLLDQRVDRYEFAQTMNWVDQTKQDKLEFGYDENSAISSINNSALRGGNGSCPWISGGKEIASAQTLTSNMYFQVLSSFTVSGDHNHFISVKGGLYKFPNEWELGSAIATTNYFMPQSSMSSYLSLIAFSSYTASIDNNLTNNWAYTNSAYSLSLSNFYNKLDKSAFSAISGTFLTSSDLTPYATKTYVDSKDPVLVGDSNVTATSSKIDNHTQWNLAVNATPVVTDTRLIGDNCVTAHTTETSGEWIVGLVQSAYEAIGSIGDISGNVTSLSSDIAYVSANCLTAHQSLGDYYKKTETSSKQEISAALASLQPGDAEVNQVVHTYSAEGKWLIASDLDPYVTTAQVNTVSSLLSAGIDYVSANGGKTYTGVAPIVVNNDEVKISAETWDLSAGNGITFTDFDELGVTRLDVTAAGGKTYTGVAPIQVDNELNEISITGEGLSAGPNIDIFSSGGYVVISAQGGVGGTSAYYTTGSTTIFEDTMNVNSDGVVTLGSYTPGQLVPTTNLTSDEGKFPMIYCRGGRSYYLLERVRQLPYYNAQTNGVLGMSAGSPSWVPMPNCYCVKLNNVTTSVDLANYSAYDKVTIVHGQEGAGDYNLYWDGKTKVIHSASYCELVKVLDDSNNIKWTFTTSGWTNDNWWDWD